MSNEKQFYHLIGNNCDFLFEGVNMDTVFICVTSSHGMMIHVAAGGYELLLMWLVSTMYHATCSLQLYAVINVHSVHSVLLLMWLIYIKNFPISQSPTVPSYREEEQGVPPYPPSPPTHQH